MRDRCEELDVHGDHGSEPERTLLTTRLEEARGRLAFLMLNCPLQGETDFELGMTGIRSNKPGNITCVHYGL